MIRIPDEYRYENPMKFDTASYVISSRYDNDLLEGLKDIRRIYDEYDADCDLENFFRLYEYEANAYNVVFESMRKLFV
jgi:hypothetical protein